MSVIQDVESSFHVLTLSPEERRAGKWQRGRVRRGLGWGHCSSDDGMKNTRRKRRGSPSAPVQDLILMEGKAYTRVRWVPTCKKPFVKRENIVLVFREFTIQRRECKDPGK